MGLKCDISVIIPIYNSQKFIKHCLDSILNQTLPANRFEIICVNDGSTDATAQILHEYQSRYTNIIVLNQQNKGQGPARNAGVAISKGKYIKFVDSDDFLHPKALSALYETAERTNVDIVVCRAFCVDESGEHVSLLTMWNNIVGCYSKKNIEELDFFNNICSPVLWDKLIKADIVKRCLSPSLRRGQDFVTLLSYISLCNSIYFIDDSLYYYRHHKDSVMAKPESRNTIMTDFQTEKMALSILKKLFQQTKAYVFYCKRIKKEWEKRLDNNLILLNDSDIFMIRQMLSDLAPSKID